MLNMRWQDPEAWLTCLNCSSKLQADWEGVVDSVGEEAVEEGGGGVPTGKKGTRGGPLIPGNRGNPSGEPPPRCDPKRPVVACRNSASISCRSSRSCRLQKYL